MYFREGNLTALRELALRTVSTEVKKDLEAFMREHGIHAVWPAGERVMVGVNEQPTSQKLLRRGWRMSSHYGADLLAAFIETPEWVSSSAE